MFKKPFKNVLVAVALAAATQTSLAAASAEDAARLGQDLTPVGAEKAGNAAGTIPAWTGGGIGEVPAGYVVGGHHPDPYADEQPLFTITAANVDEYADQLSEGQMAMFETYPDTFKMKVYPTHRTYQAPEWIYDRTRDCASSAQLTDDGNGVTGAHACYPFPVVEMLVEYSVPRFDTFVTEYSTNISTTGMFIVSDKPQAPGSTFTFEFSVADDWKLIRGKALPEHEVPPEAGVAPWIPRQRSLVRQCLAADLGQHRVRRFGDELAALGVDDAIPTPRRVKAEPSAVDGLFCRVCRLGQVPCRPEGELDLVAVCVGRVSTAHRVHDHALQVSELGERELLLHGALRWQVEFL